MQNGSTTGKAPIPDLLPARMLCEFAYCPRLGVMMWAEDLFDDNEYTVEGRTVHHRVDRPAGELPERKSKAPACKAADDEPDSEEESAEYHETFHARSVLLSSEKLRLIARLDLVEAQGMTATPVDYKRGEKPDIPEGAWPSDRIQLCAQGLLLREHGYACTGGVAYYAASKARVPVEFDNHMVTETLRQRDAFFDAVIRETLPPPLSDSRKCLGCSLVGICLPDEVGLLSLRDPETAGVLLDDAMPAEGPATADAPEMTDEEGAVRRLWPARDDDVPLIVQNHRARVSKAGERLVVHEGKSQLGEIKLMCTSEVCLYGGAQITTQALHACFDRGIPVFFMTYGGWFLGMAQGPGPRNASAMRAQFRAVEDPQCCLALARRFVTAKVLNCRTLLRRNCVTAPTSQLAMLAEMAKKAEDAEDLPMLLGLEGTAARAYFSAFSMMLKAPAEQWPFSLDGRNRRPPRDPVNALLSYLYGMVLKEWIRAILAAGLHPYQGFYHQPRFGRPALALDLMEEFRPLAGDSTVITVINTGVVGPADFVTSSGGWALKEPARKRVIEAFDRRMDVLVTHPVFDYRLSLRRVFSLQARLLARHLAGEIPAYPAFLPR